MTDNGIYTVIAYILSEDAFIGKDVVIIIDMISTVKMPNSRLIATNSLNRRLAIIKALRVFCFGKEQEPFCDKADGRSNESHKA